MELARRRPRTREELEAVLAELDVDLTELQALAQQLLDPVAAPSPPTAAVDLAAVVEDVAGRSGSGADGLPPRWETTVDDDARPAPVLAGERALRQVLFNLLGNAARHGGPHVSVHVGRRLAVAVLTVMDDGTGMAPEFLPTALLRFARAGEARDRPGSGLGLSVVDQLVTAGGGELRLCSRGAHHRSVERFDVPCVHPSDGTAATVLLPLVEPRR